MLVNTTHRKLVLNLSSPDRVTNVIPTAQKFMFKGRELVAVPHRLEEVRVLRNLGFDAPSPVAYHYRWSGQYKPFKAQYATTAFLTINPRAYVLNDMGTGKTLATLWAYDFLRAEGLVKKMLVVCPLSTMERTWADEIFKHFPHLRTAVLHGSRDRRLKLLNQDVDIYLVNHDGVQTIANELRAMQGLDVVVLDEAAVYRNASTVKWKTMRSITFNTPYLWALTGTPIPNSPTDAWGICRMVNPSTVPTSFGKFRDLIMRQMGQFRWLARDNAVEIVHKAMQPSICFNRSDCVDLPPCTYVDRQVPLTAEQLKSYKQMHATLLAEHNNGQTVTAVNEAVKVQKLVQIACGVVYDTNGDDVVLDNNPRLQEIRDVVDNASSKVIVFVPFKGVLRNVAEQLAAAGYSVGVISGDVSKSQRDDIFDRFQNTSRHSAHGIDVLIAQPAAMSHGLTLTAASVVAWVAPVTSNEIYQQANARITRPGQVHNQLIVHIEGTALERKMYARLQAKQTMQGLLLDAAHD